MRLISWRKQIWRRNSLKKLSKPVGTKSDWWAGVGQGLEESILQGGGVPLSDMAGNVSHPAISVH